MNHPNPVPIDGLVQNGARPSASILLIIKLEKYSLTFPSIIYEQLLRNFFADLMMFIQIGHRNCEKPGTRGHVHVSEEL